MKLEKIYCQSCGRLCNVSEVEVFMDFKVCEGSDQCRERIKNLPMMFIDDPYDDTLRIDPAYLGKLIRKGFYGSKYQVDRVSILNTSHYKFKSNSLVTIEFAKFFDSSDKEVDNPVSINKYICNHQVREKPLLEKILEFEGVLRKFDPATLSGELDKTRMRMKRTLKRLRRIYKQI